MSTYFKDVQKYDKDEKKVKRKGNLIGAVSGLATGTVLGGLALKRHSDEKKVNPKIVEKIEKSQNMHGRSGPEAATFHKIIDKMKKENPREAKFIDKGPMNKRRAAALTIGGAVATGIAAKKIHDWRKKKKLKQELQEKHASFREKDIRNEIVHRSKLKGKRPKKLTDQDRGDSIRKGMGAGIVAGTALGHLTQMAYEANLSKKMGRKVRIGDPFTGQRQYPGANLGSLAGMTAGTIYGNIRHNKKERLRRYKDSTLEKEHKKKMGIK